MNRNKNITVVVRTVLCIVLGGSVALHASLLDDANAAYNRQSYESAVELYRQAATAGESPALCYYNAANASFQMDKMPQAVVYYRACIRSAPSFTKAHLNLSICYYSLGDMGRTLASLGRVLKQEPRNQKGLLLQAAAFRRCGATAKAVVAFENLTRIYSTLEDPYIALGELFRDMDDYDEALRWLGAVPADGKNSEYVALLQADLYEKRKDYTRAVFFLNQAFDSDSTKRWTLYRIAALQHTMGNDLVALETCHEGLRRFKDFGEIAVLGGTISFDRGRLSEAEQFFSKGVDAGSPAAVVGLSNIRTLNTR